MAKKKELALDFESPDEEATRLERASERDSREMEGMSVTENSETGARERGAKLISEGLASAKSGLSRFMGYLGGKLRGFGQGAQHAAEYAVGGTVSGAESVGRSANNFARETVQSTIEDVRGAKKGIKREWGNAKTALAEDYTSTVADAKLAKGKVVEGARDAAGYVSSKEEQFGTWVGEGMVAIEKNVTEKITNVKKRGQDAYATVTGKIEAAKDVWSDFKNERRLKVALAERQKTHNEQKRTDEELKTAEEKVALLMAKKEQLSETKRAMQKKVDEITENFSDMRKLRESQVEAAA